MEEMFQIFNFRIVYHSIEVNSMENEEKRPYQTPALIFYGELSQITAAGSGVTPEGSADDGPDIDEASYFG